MQARAAGPAAFARAQIGPAFAVAVRGPPGHELALGWAVAVALLRRLRRRRARQKPERMCEARSSHRLAIIADHPQLDRQLRRGLGIVLALAPRGPAHHE